MYKMFYNFYGETLKRMYEYFFELWGKQPDVRDEDDLIIDILSIASQKEKLQSPLLRDASEKHWGFLIRWMRPT